MTQTTIEHQQRSPAPTRKGATPDWLLMFGKFLKHGTAIASFVPSSRSLARTIVKGIDFTKAKCVVELGAGTGPITTELVKRSTGNTRLIILERDPDFCKRLREKFPKHEVVEGDAAHLDKIFADRGVTQADHILSGLPLPSFPTGLVDSIMRASNKILTPHGTFRQLTNMPWVYYRFYKNFFKTVTFSFVPMNFPPAGVYYCRGFKETLTP
jgi:phospholipid N-methyltransferase